MFVGCSKGSGGGVTRREMLVRVGEAAFGLTLPVLLAARAAAEGGGQRAEAPNGPNTYTPTPPHPHTAKSCILLFLSGGPSQYETFDPKPEAPLEYRGTFRPIRTNVPGIEVTEHLPVLARMADRYALVRSMTHTEANHPAGVYWMITGRKYPRATAKSVAMSREDHPHLGSALARVRPPGSAAVPAFVTLPEQMNPNGPIRAGQHAGFLG